MPRVKLGDVAEERRERATDEELESLPVVGLEHFDPDRLALRRWADPGTGGFTKVFRKGDVLFGRRRAYQKKAAVAPFDGICSGDVIVIKPRKDEYARILPFVVQNDYLFDYAVGKSAGSLSPRVKWGKLSEFEFGMPTGSELGRVADTLWASENLIEDYDGLLLEEDELVKSRFVEMFGDPVLNPKGWSLSTIKETAVTYGDGPFGSNLKSSDYVESGVRVIRLGNILSGAFSDSDKSYVSQEKYERLKKYDCRPGEVVIGTLGDPILRACLVPDFGVPSIHKADCVYYETDKNKLLPVFAMWAINHPSMLQRAMYDAHGQTRGRINSTQVGKLPMILPPMTLQKEFADFAKRVDKSRVELQTARSALTRIQRRIIGRELGLEDV